MDVWQLVEDENCEIIHIVDCNIIHGDIQLLEDKDCDITHGDIQLVELEDKNCDILHIVSPDITLWTIFEPHK